MYLVAIMDWTSRRVLSWRLSTTMESDFCVQALRQALAEFGTPEILNTYLGSLFTDAAFTCVLLKGGVKVSLEGMGRYT